MVERNKNYLIKLPGEISWVMAVGSYRSSYGVCFELTGSGKIYHESVIKEKNRYGN